MTIELFPVDHTVRGIRTDATAKVNEKLVKMNKRLAKLGAPAATVTFGEIVTVEEHDEVTGIKRTWTEYDEVTVHGFEARHAGWAPIAVLDHTLVDGEAWVALFPGAITDEIALPDEFRFRGSLCDHCGINVKRNTTIVFRHDDERWLAVGTTCVLEFLGVDPANVLWLREAVVGFFDDDDFQGHAKPVVLPMEYLAIAAAVTRIHGFTKTSEGWPTRDRADEIAYGTTAKRMAEVFHGFDLSAGRADADQVVAWLETKSANDSDFIYNAKLALSAGKVSRRMTGLLAALPFVWRKDTEEAETKAERPQNFIGQVGEKIVVIGEVIVELTVETAYGASKRVTVQTDEGVVTTFGSGNDLWGVRVGDRVRWTGKVKNHIDDPKWGKQTECKLVKLAPVDADGNLIPFVAHQCEQSGCRNDVYATADTKGYTPHCPEHTVAVTAPVTVAGEKPADFDTWTAGRKAAWTRKNRVAA